MEQLFGLGVVGWVTGAETTVDALQGLFVALGFVFAQGVEQDVVGLDLVGNDFNLGDTKTLKVLELTFGDLLAGAARVADLLDLDRTSSTTMAPIRSLFSAFLDSGEVLHLSGKECRGSIWAVGHVRTTGRAGQVVRSYRS